MNQQNQNQPQTQNQTEFLSGPQIEELREALSEPQDQPKINGQKVLDEALGEQNQSNQSQNQPQKDQNQLKTQNEFLKESQLDELREALSEPQDQPIIDGQKVLDEAFGQLQNQSGSKQSGSKQSGSKQSGSKKSGSEQSGSNQSESNQSKSQSQPNSQNTSSQSKIEEEHAQLKFRPGMPLMGQAVARSFPPETEPVISEELYHKKPIPPEEVERIQKEELERKGFIPIGGTGAQAQSAGMRGLSLEEVQMMGGTAKQQRQQAFLEQGITRGGRRGRGGRGRGGRGKGLGRGAGGVGSTVKEQVPNAAKVAVEIAQHDMVNQQPVNIE